MSKRKREHSPETSDTGPSAPEQGEHSDGSDISTGPNDEPPKTDIFDYLKRHNLENGDNGRGAGFRSQIANQKSKI